MARIAAAAALVAALLALSAPVASAQGKPGPRTETQSAGTVTATLSYTLLDFSQARDVRLAITRAGVPAAVPDGGSVAAGCKFCRRAAPIGGLQEDMTGGDQPVSSLTLADLTGDGDPEIIVDLFTGGAHCCSVSVIYGWDATANAYRRLDRLWGDPGYSLADLPGGAGPELVTFDDRFAYAFCAYVCSAMPEQIFRYQDFGLVNVTREYPDRTRADLRSLRGARRQARRHRDEGFSIKGILPALCADLYLLDRGTQCRRELHRALRRGELRKRRGDISEHDNRAYIRAVLAFLAKTGYRT
jgi:hypothetical protein